MQKPANTACDYELVLRIVLLDYVSSNSGAFEEGGQGAHSIFEDFQKLSRDIFLKIRLDFAQSEPF